MLPRRRKDEEQNSKKRLEKEETRKKRKRREERRREKQTIRIRRSQNDQQATFCTTANKILTINIKKSKAQEDSFCGGPPRWVSSGIKSKKAINFDVAIPDKVPQSDSRLKSVSIPTRGKGFSRNGQQFQ